MPARRLRVVPVVGEGRVPALDGVRGLAVAMVVGAHALSAHHVGGVAHDVLTPFTDGDLGVLIFFVLSGYLITGILCREQERRGAISLRNFYVRRALRIWPAFYTYLATIAILAIGFGLVVGGGELAACALYVWNYAPHTTSWWLGHTWSLSVEEQFYLLWPAALVLLGLRRAFWLAVAVIALDPVVRLTEYFVAPSTRDHIPIYFHTRADSLLTGAAIALLPYVVPAVHGRVLQLIAHRSAQIVALAVLFASPYLGAHLQGAFLLPVGWSLQNLAVAALLLRASDARARVAAALSWRPLVALGVISYSVYLWQQLFVTSLDRVLFHNVLLEIGATLVVAYASFRLIEVPFLRLKQRFERVPPEAHRPREQPVPAGP